jgi:flagellar motor switch protein FliN/FliY
MSSSTSSSSSSDDAPADVAKIAAPADEARVYGHLLDVQVPVNVVLGSGSISVRECLALAPRSVLRLKQTAGEDLQVFAGEIPLARAEVVIVEDSTAVRLTEILKPAASEDR